MIIMSNSGTSSNDSFQILFNFVIPELLSLGRAIRSSRFVVSLIFTYHRWKIEISIFNISNSKEKYKSYEKMLRFKFVDLYVVNNFVL